MWGCGSSRCSPVTATSCEVTRYQIVVPRTVFEAISSGGRAELVPPLSRRGCDVARLPGARPDGVSKPGQAQTPNHVDEWGIGNSEHQDHDRPGYQQPDRAAGKYPRPKRSYPEEQPADGYEQHRAHEARKCDSRWFGVEEIGSGLSHPWEQEGRTPFQTRQHHGPRKGGQEATNPQSAGLLDLDQPHSHQRNQNEPEAHATGEGSNAIERAAPGSHGQRRPWQPCCSSTGAG